MRCSSSHALKDTVAIMNTQGCSTVSLRWIAIIIITIKLITETQGRARASFFPLQQVMALVSPGGQRSDLPEENNGVGCWTKGQEKKRAVFVNLLNIFSSMMSPGLKVTWEQKKMEVHHGPPPPPQRKTGVLIWDVRSWERFDDI